MKMMALICAALVGAAAAEEQELAHWHMYDVFDHDLVNGWGADDLAVLAFDLGLSEDGVLCAEDLGTYFQTNQAPKEHEVDLAEPIHAQLLDLAALKAGGQGCSADEATDVPSLLQGALQRFVGVLNTDGEAGLTFEELKAGYAKVAEGWAHIDNDVGGHGHAWVCLEPEAILEKHGVVSTSNVTAADSLQLAGIAAEYLASGAEGCPAHDDH